MKKLNLLLAAMAASGLACGFATSANANAGAYLFGYTYPIPGESSGPQQLTINGSTVVNADTTGWYDYKGEHFASNSDYIVGDCSIGTCGGLGAYNDFFTFNLAGVSGSVTSVTFSAFNPGGPYPGYSGKPSSTYTLWDVTTPIGVLNSDNSTATGIYADLGSGISYGSVSVSAADNGALVRVTLNAAGIAAVNAAVGSEFAIGGSLGTFTVPEPSTWAMMLVGFAGLGYAGYRKPKARTALSAI